MARKTRHFDLFRNSLIATYAFSNPLDLPFYIFVGHHSTMIRRKSAYGNSRCHCGSGRKLKKCCMKK